MTTNEAVPPAPRSHDVVLTITSRQRDGTAKVGKLYRKQVWILAGCIVAIHLFASIMDGAVVPWFERLQNDARRPVMENLANAGGDAAGLWLVKNYPEDNHQRLPELVAKGYAEAMFYQGVLQSRGGDKEVGQLLIEQSAGKGYLPAMQLLEMK